MGHCGPGTEAAPLSAWKHAGPVAKDCIVDVTIHALPPLLRKASLAGHLEEKLLESNALQKPPSKSLMTFNTDIAK